MAQQILQNFLDNQFIKLDDDENLIKLKQASEVLKESLAGDRGKIIGICLAALDPDISDHEPLINEVQQVIVSKWSTFLNNVAKSRDIPVTYIRAVMLEALSELADGDIELAALIWYIGNDILRYYHADRERPILQAFLASLGMAVEGEAYRIWGLAKSTQISPINEPGLEDGQFTPVLVSKDAIQRTLKAAAGYSGWSAGENPSAPQNGNSQWTDFFADRAATGLAAEIHRISEGQQVFVEKQKAILTAYFEQVAPYFRQIGDSLKQSLESLKQRSNLLFWKQALYSLLLQKSYREMPSGLAVICMAADLSRQLPEIYPRSVDYFFRETLMDVLGQDANTPVKIGALLETLGESQTEWNPLLPADPGIGGRKPFLIFLKQPITDGRAHETLKVATGIQSDSMLTWADLGVWVLHDLQALRLTVPNN